MVISGEGYYYTLGYTADSATPTTLASSTDLSTLLNTTSEGNLLLDYSGNAIAGGGLPMYQVAADTLTIENGDPLPSGLHAVDELNNAVYEVNSSYSLVLDVTGDVHRTYRVGNR